MSEYDFHESVVFNSINVQSIYTNAGIFVGDNRQNFWSSHTKDNHASGKIHGRNFLYKPFNLIIDNDLFDQIIRSEWKS